MNRRGMYVLGILVMAQTGLLGCEQDYGLKLSKKIDSLVASVPSANPSSSPSSIPSAPLAEPAGLPSAEPSSSPEAVPSSTPVAVASPSASPSPSAAPSVAPSVAPTVAPTSTPSEVTVHSAVDSYSPKPASAATKVDLLFVIDNSQSMGDNQAVLRSSFQSFIEKFSLSHIDYNIGIISTDVDSYANVSINSDSNPFKGYVNPYPTSKTTHGNLLTRFPGINFLSPFIADVVPKFSANANLGTKGSGNERGIYSALNVLSASKLSNENAGFRRSDALLSVMVISDEDEEINCDPVLINGAFDHSECKVDQRIDRYVARMKELCGPGCPGYRADLVVDLDAAMPASGVTYPLIASGYYNPYPNFYRKLAARTGASLLNIKSPTWGAKLADVGAAIVSQAQNEFKISHAAIPNTIKVFVNNVQIPANQFVYYSDRMTIGLLDPALSNAAGGLLRIEYNYL